ncbi:HGxxPAAW family protein [Arthrobacter sp. 35W]|uniref:HGxxPAAW family protein n=1 Tax=Arthrobacter sp. 35W TaxID=1132441 RepID=UPI00041B0C15|nr:HGxxPAAW family protein [Arthrobacter sp. 35W]
MSNKTATQTTPASSTALEVHNGELGHGNSPAAWTCVAVMLIGALVSCIAFVIGVDATVLFIVGIGVMVVGLILGLVLRAAGYGVGGSKLKNTGH